jgi:hypothetical protein
MPNKTKTMKLAVYRITLGPLRRPYRSITTEFARYASSYRRFDFQPDLLTKYEKFKHVGDLYRYSKDICNDPSQKIMLINELSSLDYPKEQRSILLWGLRRTKSYQVMVDIYDNIVSKGSVGMINEAVDSDSFLLFAQALSRTGDFAKVSNTKSKTFISMDHVLSAIDDQAAGSYSI